MNLLVWGWLALILSVTSASSPQVAAQTIDNTWAAPQNLSHSGTATNPALVVDAGGVSHVVWQDNVARYVYARFVDGQWTVPQRTSLHVLFGSPPSATTTARTEEPLHNGPNPLFVAGPGRYSFAIWISARGALYAGRVSNGEFHNVAAWTATRQLSASAATFAAAVDARGYLHVAYLRTVDGSGNPAGLYYVRSRNNGLDWSAPKRLYESAYFHILEAGEANLSLVTAGTAEASVVHVAWDNRPRKQALLARSPDSGETWEQPVQVAGPETDSGLAGPFNVRVGAIGNNVVLVWQYGEPDADCTQLFQSSDDAGVTWSAAQAMIKDVPGCAAANEFVTEMAPSPGALLFLLTHTQRQVILSAWNGSQWSEPRAQPILSGFSDPEVYRPVDYGCQQSTVIGGRLYVVGCDQGEGGDIWVTSREVADTEAWFLPPVWSPPAPITDQAMAVEAVALAAPDDNLIHAFFGVHQDAFIYYTRWDGERWSRITPVLQVPEGEAGWPVVASGPGHELILIARSTNGSLYFSRTKSSDAVTASGWSTPTRLPIAQDGTVGLADIGWDAAGKIHIAYAVPIHNERGIYLVQSSDQGRNWSEPRQVFDGAAASLDLVGAPSMLVAGNSAMHLLWTEQSIPVEGVAQPRGLYYARSENAGLTFAQAELVVEAPVTWHKMVADDQGSLHRLWQRTDMPTTIWDQVSLDGGHSWQLAQRLPAEGQAAAVTLDPSGRLHLVGFGASSLGHWLWQDGRWKAEAPLRWSAESQGQEAAALLAAAIKMDGRMVAVMVIPGSTGDRSGQVLYTTRTLELPPRQTDSQATAVVPPPTQSPGAPTQTQAVPPAEVSATLAATEVTRLAPAEGATDETSANNELTPFLLALLPVGLLLLVVLSLAALRTLRARPR